jgi:hypothetical protein
MTKQEIIILRDACTNLTRSLQLIKFNFQMRCKPDTFHSDWLDYTNNSSDIKEIQDSIIHLHDLIATLEEKRYRQEAQNNTTGLLD